MLDIAGGTYNGSFLTNSNAFPKETLLFDLVAVVVDDWVVAVVGIVGGALFDWFDDDDDDEDVVVVVVVVDVVVAEVCKKQAGTKSFPALVK